jgi:hypothetical protein
MSENYNMGKLGVVAPFKAKEGTITITDGASAHGTIKVPVLSAGLKKGDLVELDSEMTVTALNSGVPIGIVYNTPKWDVEPVQNYTQAQAVSAGYLREAGIETIFKKILTMDAKASEGITAGKYCVLSKDGVKLSASSGSTASDMIALSAQDSNNRVVVGFI